MAARTVSEQFRRLDEFTSLLAAAELNASSDWECRFTADVSANYQRWQGDMYLSDSQLENLDRIANK
ncbi:hypothetical protein IB234_15135 [Pseudomonas sp. PDM16]|uniref:hypothetical protein n=1 Tax=Pseudomonas sp. PDM16 TaxID=2769292 RepID=UPI0017826ED4|nr:hypothetical protein [Pseudomonas sp. PDM16]MBD9415895.1 hypothetical protein [Pseudomonas sp. PDM16]